MAFLAEAWSWQQTLMMAIGVLVVAAVMLRASRQRLNATRGGSTASTGGSLRIARSAENVRDQLDHLMVQLEELARATTGQIETRYAKLETLLQEADRKIATLESLLKATPTAAALGSPSRPDEVKPEHRRIYELADAGRSPVQIAQETARDVGEIELILALRRK